MFQYLWVSLYEMLMAQYLPGTATIFTPVVAFHKQPTCHVSSWQRWWWFCWCWQGRFVCFFVCSMSCNPLLGIPLIPEFIVHSFPCLMILSLFIHPYRMVKPQCLPREIAFVMKVVAFYKQSKSWHLLQFLRVNNQQMVSSCRWWWLCSCCRRFSWRKQTRSHLTS